MSKLFKRAAAVILTAVMMMGVFGTGAFAAETASKAQSEESVKYDLRYNFSNIGKDLRRFERQFEINTAGSYRITFDGASGSGATVCFYDTKTRQLVNTLTIPVYVSGMPTLSTYFDFPRGTYEVKVKSSSTNATTSGYFIIYGVDGYKDVATA